MKHSRIALMIGLALGVYWLLAQRGSRREERWQPVPLARKSVGASELSAPPGSEPASAVPALHEVRAAASDYRAGRDNAFFDEKKFLSDLAPSNEKAALVIESIASWLADPSELFRLDGKKDFMTSPPKVVVDRMAGLDLVEALARAGRGADAAQAALAALAARDLPTGVSETVRKAVLAEQYDALTGLARLAPAQAQDAFAKMPPARKKALAAALVAGLVDAGWTREDALAAVRP